MTHISSNIEAAASLLKAGEVVAIPTETVYGLGADATNDAAVAKIFEAKGRPSDNPLIVHIADLKQLHPIAGSVPKKAEQLMDVFWPGALTIILPKGEGLSDKVTAGLSTVGIRMPDHPIARNIILEAGLPIAAPSANTSGRPSPTSAAHVWDDLQGKIPLIVDGGPTGIGVESTVIDCSVQSPVILRPGGITQEEIEAVIGKVQMDAGLLEQSQKPRSPGMKYSHYAPIAPLRIIEGSPAFFKEQIQSAKERGLKVGVLGIHEKQSDYEGADIILTCGPNPRLQDVAQKLYANLRKFDEYSLDVILSESFPREGLGQAIMNRLEKAAGHQVIKEDGNTK
ncbi:MAG: L-threonylcarbamoyladenylate synthase [Turicibacter sp.]|nr:L-threonylcarbamoyladenylate synthase [Turicibacter sp.]